MGAQAQQRKVQNEFDRQREAERKAKVAEKRERKQNNRAQVLKPAISPVAPNPGAQSSGRSPNRETPTLALNNKCDALFLMLIICFPALHFLIS